MIKQKQKNSYINDQSNKMIKILDWIRKNTQYK